MRIVAKRAGTMANKQIQGLSELRVIGFINQPRFGKVV